MRKNNHLYAAVLTALAFTVAMGLGACQKKPENPKPETLSPIKAGPGEVSAESLAKDKDRDQPPNVRVKRDEEGNYSWEITGKDVGRIIQADRALRKSFGEGRRKSGD